MDPLNEKNKGEAKKESARLKSNSVSELRRKFEENTKCDDKSAINGVKNWSLTRSTSKITQLQQNLKKDSLLFSDKLVRSSKRVSFSLTVDQETSKPKPAPRNKLSRTSSVPTQVFKVEVKNVQKETVVPVIIDSTQDENSNIINKDSNTLTKFSETPQENSKSLNFNSETLSEQRDLNITIKGDSPSVLRKDKKLSKKESKIKNKTTHSSPKLKKKSESLAETKKVLNYERKEKFPDNIDSVEIHSNVIESTEIQEHSQLVIKQQSSELESNNLDETEVIELNNTKENSKNNLETEIIISNNTDYKDIVFADPEDQHLMVRAESSDDSLDKIESDLDSFVMDNSKVKERKRSNSFRRIFKGGIFGNNKKKDEKEVKKNAKKTENAVFADNAQNESFNRTPHSYEHVEPNLEEHYAQMHITRFQQTKANFEKSNDYVCMDSPRFHNNTNPQETSSSSNTLDSENLIYENKNSNLRKTFFETPPRAHETYQNVQLVKPKALIPINSERALPNPYQDKPGKTIERNLNANSAKEPPHKGNEIDVIYGTVYDQKDKHNSYASSESTKSLEITKLKLPTNREKVELQPRLKSPIPQNTISTDKIIATELLKDKKGLNSPTHQRFDVEIDYPQNNGPNPNNQFTTNVLVHVDSPNRSITPTRSITPSTSSLQRTPPKHEIRQNVEAFCWKELKKLKEREDYELQMRIQSTPFGHAEEPIIQHRSRGLSPSIARNTRRSASLPREVLRQKRQEEMETKKVQTQPNFSRNSPQRSTIGGYQQMNQKPIFRRGSLTQQSFMENQAIYNKKVSFNGANHREPWPTKNGYTQSPPQRRVDLKREFSLEDDVFLPNEVNRPLTREEIFLINQQKQKQMLQAQQANMVRRMPNIKEVSADQNRYDYPPSDATYDSLDNQGRKDINHRVEDQRSNTIVQQRGPRDLSQDSNYGIRNAQRPNEGNHVNREPIYGSRKSHEPIYGARNNYGLSGTNEPIYGSRTHSGLALKNTRDPGYATKTMNNPNYGVRNVNERNFNAGNVTEPIYGTKVVNNVNYGASMANNSNYGAKISNEVIYGAKLTHAPNYNGRKVNDSIYATKYSNESISKNSNEPIYGIKNNNEIVYNLRSPTGEPIYGRRLDFSPHQKVNSVNNKVCDIYGKIHDTQDHRVMSPPVSETSGVLYGQLQRNMNVSPLQYQSYNQIQNNSNFVRGSRLTASVNDMYRRYQGDPRHLQRREQVYEPPNRPLPPIPNDHKSKFGLRRRNAANNDNNASNPNFFPEEEWNADGKSGRGLSGNDSGNLRSETDGDLRSRSRNNRRDDPRRHTLAGEQYGVMSGQGGPLSRTMDLEGQPRGYPPPSNAMLFDDDPGIMSEVETSSTGFRRGGKQRSSLPVVRTPSKTLERPLGLVFLQYRNETKRALLPNEITSIDTVKALFVRSFPKQLSMEYLDSPQVKIYIHDSSKDMFYELEDLRSHLREIRDRSVLRLFESADVSGGLPMAGIGIAGGVGHFEDPSYFSEPEFDSEYQHQHIHKSKGSASKGAPYYIGSTASLPRAGLLRAYSPAVGSLPPERLKTLPTGAPPKPQRAYSSGAAIRSGEGARAPNRFASFQRPNNSLYNIPDGYMSSPERGSRYEDPYYSQYGTRSGSITPVIDEEISDTELLDEQYSLYGVKMPSGPRPAPRTQFASPAAPPYDATRIRVEHMERQLANLTGLVQKALTQSPATLQVPTSRDPYRGDDFDMNSTSSSQSLPDDTYVRSETKTPKLGKGGCHKSVSFEKSVSFSDEPPDMNSPKQHSPQHSADTKPTKPAIKSSTLPRTSSQERDRLKPAPPPKPASLSPGQYDGRHIYRDLQLTPEMYNQLRGLQKKAKDLRAEVRNLRRMSQAQAHSVRETIRDTFIKIRAMLLAGGEQVWQAGNDQERVRLSREEDLYKQEMIRLETDLSDLESTVEELRGNVINRKTRVNMSDVENMALVLSKSSKTVADLKLRFPVLQDSMKSMLSSEMEKVVREEQFLKEEPERLESALRRCKKLTGTLVTLKRLASVQEQRLPCSTSATDGSLSPTETAPVTPTSAQHSKSTSIARVGQIGVGGECGNTSDSHQRPENALDALLDELQTFSKPHTTVNTQIPQVSFPDSEPPILPVKGIPPSHFGQNPGMREIGRKGSMDSATILPTQNLTVSTATGSLRRLHSYPSGSDTDNSPPIQPIQRVQVDSKTSGKPPIPERNSELLQQISTKRVPPPPPPRTSSKSPLASPTSPSLPPRSPASNLQHIQNVQNMVENKPQSQFEAATQNLGLSTLRRNVQNRSSVKDRSQTLPRNIGSNLQVHNVEVENVISASNSSSCESVNSQDGTKKRKEELEHRHQELLKKQKALQEQYARLQQLQRGTNTLAVIPPAPDQLLKKTGSESNILQKMGLQLSTSQMTGSLNNLPNSAKITVNNANKESSQQNNNTPSTTGEDTSTSSNSSSTTNKVYETDIL